MAKETKADELTAKTEAPAPDTAASEAEAPAPDTAPGDTPKAKAKPTTAPRKRASGSRAKRVDIKAGMTDLYATVGALLPMVPAPVVEGTGKTRTQLIGQEIVANAGQCGDAWAKAAADNPQIRRALERALTVSTVGMLVSAHLPIVLTVVMVMGAPAPLPPATKGASQSDAPRHDGPLAE